MTSRDEEEFEAINEKVRKKERGPGEKKFSGIFKDSHTTTPQPQLALANTPLSLTVKYTNTQTHIYANTLMHKNTNKKNSHHNSSASAGNKSRTLIEYNIQLGQLNIQIRLWISAQPTTSHMLVQHSRPNFPPNTKKTQSYKDTKVQKCSPKVCRRKFSSRTTFSILKSIQHSPPEFFHFDYYLIISLQVWGRVVS